MEVVFETPRFILRRFTLDDVENIFQLDSDPEVHRFLGNNPITKLSQAEEQINRVLDQYRNDGLGRLIIIEKSLGQFVGWSGIKLEKGFLEIPYYDVGYRLIQAYWGKGIATEVAKASLDYGFEEQGIEKVYGAAYVENKASDHILSKKLKMNYEFNKTIMNMDIRFYSLTKEQWRSKPQ